MYSLNFEFRESLCNFYVNAKYNLHKCEEQLSQFLFTSAVILLGTSGLLGLLRSLSDGFALFCIH